MEVAIRPTWSQGIFGAVILALAWTGIGAAAPPGAGRADSTRAPGLLNDINFHPTYSSGYTVNRSSRSWDQSMSFARRLGVFDLTNSWGVGIRTDKNQNNLRGKRGEMKFGLNYLVKEYGDWTVGLQGEFHRDGSFSTYKPTQQNPEPVNHRDQVENTSNFGLAVSSRLPNSAMQRFIPFLRDFNLTTAGSAGLNNDRSVSRRLTLLDSTRVAGFFQHYDMGLDGNVRSFRLSSRLITDQSTGDSKTLQRLVATGAINTVSKETTDNRKKDLRATVDYAHGEALKANVQGHMSDELNQYWDIQANNNNGGQESKDGKDHGAGVEVDWTPAKDATLHGEYSRQDLSADYKLQARDFFKRTDSGKMDGRLKIPTFLPLLAGLEIESGLQIDETDNILEETADYKQRNHKMRTVLRRQFGPKVQIQGTNELSLLQYFYDDRSSDRDEKRVFTDGVLLYNPSVKFNGTFNVNWSERHSVNIPSDKSANNSTTQTYKVSGEIGYKRGLMSVNQRYTIEADYTYYDFNDNLNNLARSNEVLTTISDHLTSGWGFQMQHTYQFRDQGMYLRTGPGLPRAYSANTKETRHVLALTTNYPIGKEIRIEARQTYDRRASRVVATGRVNSSIRGELSLRGDLNHQFNKDFSLLASFQKTQSTSERNYWTVNASIQRSF